MKTIGVIGTGNMGGALIKGFLSAQQYQVLVYDVRQEAAAEVLQAGCPDGTKRGRAGWKGRRSDPDGEAECLPGGACPSGSGGLQRHDCDGCTGIFGTKGIPGSAGMPGGPHHAQHPCFGRRRRGFDRLRTGTGRGASGCGRADGRCWAHLSDQRKTDGWGSCPSAQARPLCMR